MGEKPGALDEAETQKAGSMSQIQNMKREGGDVDAGGGAGGDPSGPMESANLNLSKSNIDRLGTDAGDADPTGASESTTVKSGKSNSSDRQSSGVDDDDPSDPSDATTVKSSKSNSSE